METIKKDNKVYHFHNGKCLISPTSAIRYFIRGKFVKIPDKVLEQARQSGSEFMNYLTTKWSKHHTTDEQDLKFSKMESNLLVLFKQLGITPKMLECEVYNNIWYGSIDIDCGDCFVELKTRSNYKLELESVFQCEVYKSLANKPYHIIYIDRKTSLAMELKPSAEMIKEAQEIKQCLENVYQKLNK